MKLSPNINSDQLIVNFVLCIPPHHLLPACPDYFEANAKHPIILSMNMSVSFLKIQGLSLKKKHTQYNYHT